MKSAIAAVLLAVAGIASAAPTQVTASRQQLPDGSRSLVHEAIVNAPVAAVWDAISTAEGWKRWAVPVAWVPAGRPDVIETSYTAGAKPGDASTIQQEVLLRVPQRLMLFRTIKAPAGFPDFDTYRQVTSLFELEPVGDTRTLVRLTGTGYADTGAGRRLIAFFERGNSVSLQSLGEKVGTSGPVPAMTGGLAPLSFLIGHCWRGEFAARKEQDTHCFEAVYGGKHVRDRHEVTGGKAVYRGETLYSWNAEIRRVEYVYWNSLGGVSRGTMVPKEGILDFGDESHILPDGRTLTISTIWRPLGPDSYQTASIRNDVTGEQAVTYKRID